MSESIAYRELVFDLDLYPRMEVDAERVDHLKHVLEANGGSERALGELLERERVDHLRAVLESGGSLPPIIVDRSTRKVIDGFHRSRAYFGLHGAKAKIPCVFREYDDKGAMFLDAIRLNATHGKPLTRKDQVRCIALAERIGVSVAQIASVLNVRSERVSTLRQAQAKQAGMESLQSRGRRAAPHRKEIGQALVTAGERDDLYGMTEINWVLLNLHNGDIRLRNVTVRRALMQLVKLATERLQETKPE